MDSSEIHKINISPCAVFLLSMLSMGFGGYFLIGQGRKAFTAPIFVMIGLVLFGIPGITLWSAFSIDAWKCATKVKNGNSINIDECYYTTLYYLQYWRKKIRHI